MMEDLMLPDQGMDDLHVSYPPQSFTPTPFLTPKSPSTPTMPTDEEINRNQGYHYAPTPKRKLHDSETDFQTVRGILGNAKTYEDSNVKVVANGRLKNKRKRRIMAIKEEVPPTSTPLLPSSREIAAAAAAGVGMMSDQDLQTQLVSLKQHHEVQRQMLLHQFHEQQMRLVQEQDQQMQNHIKQRQQEFLEQQKQLEEQQRLEQEHAEQQRIEQIKNKKKEEESAVASTEVKLKLQEFVLNKKHREAQGKMSNSPPQFRHWATQHSSLDQHSPPQSGLSPPYRPAHLLGQYENDFPLRKTVSDSNLKVRSKLKEKVVQRSSPLLRRKDLHQKRKPQLSIDTTMSNSNPDSGPNSPPSSQIVAGGQEVPTSQQGKEEGVGAFPLQMMSKMVINQSMPNISIGLPRDPANPANQANSAEPHHGNMSNMTTEAEARARAAVHYGMPLTAHMLHGTLPFYPSLPVIDSEFTPPTSPAYISQMKALEAHSTSKLAQSQVTNMAGVPYTVPNNMSMTPITDAQVAQARIHRRLNRTQSAPLPLVQPGLLPQPGLLLQQQEQLLKENQKLFLKQRLQNTVLQRVGSKNHMENVDEEVEARLAQEMKEVREREEEDVVIISDRDDPIPLSIHDSAPDVMVDSKALLIRQREAIIRQRTVSGGSPPATGGLPHRPLARAQSSPAVSVPLSPPQNIHMEPNKCVSTTGLAYDTLMLKHSCICGNNANHPEHAGRLQSIWARLQETGLVNRCERIKSRKATIEELQTCHGEAYTLLYGTNSLNRQKLDPKLLETLPSRFCLLPCGGVGVDSDTVWNDLHTAQASRMAAGCVIDLAMKVALGEVKNGMAVVRPPGHHAEANQAMGFCYFNSIAVAAKQLQERLKLEKILIVDWDVHHGNSTQQMFYYSNHVLYISIHRHDNGNFFPGTGAPEECGADEGLGFNVNLAWTGSLQPPMGDAEYLAAFRTIVMPVARDYDPDIILVSAGFDAALGHAPPLGGYQLSSELFGHMTRQLMTLAQGRVVLVLEGGYDLPSICDASEACMQALLGDEVAPLKDEVICQRPHEVAVETLANTIKFQAPHWPVIRKYSGTLGYSLIEAQQREREEADTVSAFASLSVVRETSPCLPTRMEGPSVDTSEPMEES